jgi:hypothetical protein
MSTNKPGMVVHTCNPKYTGGIGRRIMVQDWPQKKDPIQKITKTKRAGGVAQVVECLPTKHESLS